MTKQTGRAGSTSFSALISLAAAIDAGLVYHYVTKFISIFILMPVGSGAIVGAVIGGVVTKRQCRNPVLGVNAQAVCGTSGSSERPTAGAGSFTG